MVSDQHNDSILILDFGSQVTQLIARRVRESGIYSEIFPFSKAAKVGKLLTSAYCLDLGSFSAST